MASKTGGIFFCFLVYSGGHWESILKNWAIFFSNEAGDKNQADGSHFSEVPRLRKEISTN